MSGFGVEARFCYRLIPNRIYGNLKSLDIPRSKPSDAFRPAQYSRFRNLEKYTLWISTLRNPSLKFFKALDHVNGNLGHLVSFVREQREKEKQPVGREDNPTEKDYAAVGKVFVSTYGSAPKGDTDKPKGNWRRFIKKWKPTFESIGICFAVIYAVVTCLRGTISDTIFSLNKSLGRNIRFFGHPGPTADSKVGVNITNTGKIPMLSSFVAATIEVIPKDKPALLSDGNHGADGEYHSFLFPNDNFHPCVWPLRR